MQSREVLRRLERRTIVVLHADELSELLESADTVREERTSIAGLIRILRIDGQTVVQEQPPDSKKVVLRKFSSREEAELFFEKRLQDRLLQLRC